MRPSIFLSLSHSIFCSCIDIDVMKTAIEYKNAKKGEEEEQQKKKYVNKCA